MTQKANSLTFSGMVKLNSSISSIRQMMTLVELMNNHAMPSHSVADSSKMTLVAASQTAGVDNFHEKPSFGFFLNKKSPCVKTVVAIYFLKCIIVYIRIY